MKFVEKKCPNCGGNLEFGENDKSCKCQYCHREFEIERDLSNDQEFNLITKEISKEFLKSFKYGRVASLVIGIIAVVVFLVIFITMLIHMFSFDKNTTEINEHNITIPEVEEIIENKIELIQDANEIDSHMEERLDSKSSSYISRNGEGVNNAYHSYSMTGNLHLEKIYVAYKEGTNYIIPVYRGIYHDFFHQENQYTVYIPVRYIDVKNETYLSLGKGTIEAPEYYFNAEQTSYTYGYGSMDDVYNNVIQPLSGEYTITEK